MRLSYQTITWGGVVGHPVGVTSIKDLFYEANGSTETALREIASAGYEGVEIFDGNLRQYEGRPNEFRQLLADTGLQLVATYSGGNFIFPEILDEELWRIEKAAALAAGFGAEHLIVGGGAQRSTGTVDTDYDRLGAALDSVVDIAERNGLRASYHPHLTTIVENPDQIDRIMAATRINLCPDTAHVTAGGGNPADVIRRYPGRVVYAHLKDFRATPFAFLPLGTGEVDFAAVLDALEAAGHDGWVTVELDSHEGDPAEPARASRKVLDELLARRSR